jgi:hypothetical protein
MARPLCHPNYNHEMKLEWKMSVGAGIIGNVIILLSGESGQDR